MLVQALPPTLVLQQRVVEQLLLLAVRHAPQTLSDPHVPDAQCVDAPGVHVPCPFGHGVPPF